MIDKINPKIKAIIGLGNPGKEYERTYHNTGVIFVEHLKRLPQSEPYTILISGEYMNESGRFVAKELRRNGLKPEELLIAHDDSDISIGSYKLSFGRGAGGHHGVESTQKTLKTKSFWRLRIGIRPKAGLSAESASRRRKAEEFVLKKITLADRLEMEKAFDKAITEISKI